MNASTRKVLMLSFIASNTRTMFRRNLTSLGSEGGKAQEESQELHILHLLILLSNYVTDQKDYQ